MSTAKRALKKQEALHAITHGKEQVRKLPETLKLSRSQSLSLTALNNDEQRLRREVQERLALIEATNKARVEVLDEISKVHALSVEEISGNYQFNGGDELFQPKR